MSLHTTVLVRNKIENNDVFRAPEYVNRLFVSDRIKATIDKYFVGDIFESVKLI